MSSDIMISPPEEPSEKGAAALNLLLNPPNVECFLREEDSRQMSYKRIVTFA